MKKLFIIDGNSLINRAFYALPPLATRDGKVYNAVFGFTSIIIKLLTEYKPTHMVVAFDAGRKTFRNELYSEYKAGRKGMPEELAAQLAPLKELLVEMGIKILEKPGIEADDIIGTLSNRFRFPNVIVTGDRDCLQLIDSDTEVWLTKHGISDILSMNERQLADDTGLTPAQIVDLKSLMGDSSDNIPGVPGIGEKTAKDLLARFGTLDGVYQNLDQITGKLKEKLAQNEELARLSFKLATIDTNSEVDCTLDECTVALPFNARVKERFTEYEFNSLLKRAELFSDAAPVARESVQPEPVAVKSLAEIQSELSGKVAILQQEDHMLVATSGSKCFKIKGGFAELAPIFADAKLTKIVHKLKPILHALNGEVQGTCLDLGLAIYLINSNVKNDSLIDIFAFLQLDREPDAAGLFIAWQEAERKLAELELTSLYFDLELPLVPVLYDMEKQGVSVDIEVLEKLGQNFNTEIEGLKQQICHLAGTEFNINSPKQLSEILFDKLALKTTGNKKRSTAVDKLEELVGSHPIVELLLRYRAIAKLQSTYIEGLKPFIDQNNKIHTQFNQTLTVTGRLSSNEPNLQNIPIRTKEGRVLRKIFTSSGTDKVLLDVDYSQIELRLLAHYSGDANLVKAYAENRDIHTTTASQIFEVPYNQITSDQRRAAKAVNFGIIYGISPYGLARNIGTDANSARRYIERYFQTYPTIKNFLESSVESAKKNGFVTTLLGRRRNIAEVFSNNHNVAMFGERAAMNMPLQGTASDIIKLAMLKITQIIKEKGLKSKLILQIHDELIFDTPKSEVAQLTSLVRECMENIVKLRVPLVVDISSGRSWFDCK